jgi:hypothetical protein
MKGDRGFRLARAAALAALAALIVGLLAVGSGLKGAAVIPRGLAGRPGGEETQAVAQRLAVLERGWVPNAGQWDERAAFAAPGYFGTTWVTKDGELRHVASKEDCEKRTSEAGEPEVPFKRFRKPCPVQSWVLAERWVGGKVKGIRGEEELETKVSYFLGNDPAKHRSNLASYRYVSLGEVWPGVEVKLKASQKTVEKLFYVRPGANLGKVRVELRGANRLRLSQEGELVIETGLGELALSKPVAWQEKDGQKLPVQASYRLFGKSRYGFLVAGADPSLPLVIDPILQSTYLGGSDNDSANALAIAPSGDVYVAGTTYSTDFPNTAGGAQASNGGSSDAFVARLNSSLTQILQSTYLGESGSDGAWALAIGPAPNYDVYVAGGGTDSTNFPNTSGGAQASKVGSSDAFVARLNATLTSNLQSTYLGGSGFDGPWALAIGPAPNYDVYVAGTTSSTNFPNTSGGAQASNGGFWDAFVARLNAGLTSNLQSTYLGGSGFDDAFALAIAGSGDVYVAGRTSSTNFPNTSGGAQASNGGFSDAFVARLNASLTSNPQSTYLGEARAITPPRWPSVRHQTTRCTWRGPPVPPTSPTLPAARRQVTAAAPAPATVSWRGLTPALPKTPSPPTWGEATTMRPSRWPSVRHQTTRSTWRGTPIPPTSPTLPAARRQARAVLGTLSWRGLTPASPPTPSPPTWGEAGTMRPTRWPSPAAVRCTWRGLPSPPTSPTLPAGRRQAPAAMVTPSWRG